ncbi:hypothetical protein [Spiroplasma endosymbiont of Phyllotreta cruciferae]|uniref:hypothetical protein n=1 Tax=Spiroplasma endosymbiont of Phyllotreta cruciferae TaxID=2886375 RepID=UPI0020A172D6|nr:hypothetical protein [Spiroplasma endosymbiont of Phyllotreta cruciferae]
MNKKYLLIIKSKYGDLKTEFFYTLEEAKITAEEAKITANVENQQEWLTTIIDLEDNNITWKGDK